MSQIEAATLYAGWRFVLKLNGLQPQEEKCYHVVSSKTGSQDWLAMLSLPNICRWEAWKEWAPFSWRSCKRSWHNFAAAKDQTPEPQLHQSFADGSRVKVFWSPSGTFCPKARGLSPQRIWEQAPCVFAAWPCLSCPPKAANSMQHSKSETYKKIRLIYCIAKVDELRCHK